MKIIDTDGMYTDLVILLLMAAAVLALSCLLIKIIADINFQKISNDTKNTQPFTNEDFEMFNGKCCESVAFQIENHTCADTEFGNLSRRCAILILRGLAENMHNDETLSEYFSRQNLIDDTDERSKY